MLGACLKRLGGVYLKGAREVLREDAELDSDNSEEEEEFRFDRNDLFELERRRRIIVN